MAKSEPTSEAWQFLGAEFLLWMWFHSEESGGEFVLSDRDSVGVAFDRFLEFSGVPLHPDDGDTVGPGKVTLRGDLPTRTAEAGAALRSGRVPSSASLTLGIPDRTYEVTLDAARFDLRSVRILASEDGALPEDAGDRARMLFEVPRLLDALYARFLEERLSPKFRTQWLPRLRGWIDARARPRAMAAPA